MTAVFLRSDLTDSTNALPDQNPRVRIFASFPYRPKESKRNVYRTGVQGQEPPTGVQRQQLPYCALPTIATLQSHRQFAICPKLTNLGWLGGSFPVRSSTCPASEYVRQSLERRITAASVGPFPHVTGTRMT
ncbi:hypothetical protein BHE74_00021151 [Ensete ventricosum]|nr:hypothetical protein GW17_00042473 [Ensete ventricosum]RWW71123.1 hypothetical protein BHE74_00021151 [Ensete ventricosum]RZR98954.1 hypothetical protein BHM03_00028410 [Ensete ventricosum]